MQSEEQQKRHQESQATRLADLELLLQALATKTEVCKNGPLLSLRRHLENMYVDFMLKCDKKTFTFLFVMCGRRCNRSSNSMSRRSRKERKMLSQRQTHFLSGKNQKPTLRSKC